MVKASAPGKCILFGEHAVVYGQPAVACSINQRMIVELKRKLNSILGDLTGDIEPFKAPTYSIPKR